MDSVELFVVDKPNVNGNIFSREVLEKMVVDANERAVDGKLFGSFDSFEIKTDNISHRVSRVYFDGDKVCADVEILDNNAGKKIIDNLKNVEFFACGRGELVDNFVVDYDLNCVNVQLKSCLKGD